MKGFEKLQDEVLIGSGGMFAYEHNIKITISYISYFESWKNDKYSDTLLTEIKG